MANQNGSRDEDRTVARPDHAERAEILKRAQEGDERTLPRLRAMFDDEGMKYAEIFGDMAAHAEKSLIAAVSGKNLAVKEGLARKLRALRVELAGPRPSPIERLLAERAAFCWVTLHDYERTYADAGSMTLPQAEYHRRRIDSAHRRYLSSLKTLATVRKLALPSIQVNIGENQVNVGGV